MQHRSERRAADARAYDVVVVGGGVAGWTAARAAQLGGATVALVEKAEEGPGMGNTVLSGGLFHAAYHDPERRSPDELAEALLARSESGVRPELVEAWARSVARAHRFLAGEGAAHGVLFAARGPYEYEAQTLQPFRTVSRDLVRAGAWRQAGPNLLLTAMHARLGQAGGTFVSGSRATRLLETGGAVTGLEFEDGFGRRGTLRAEAVILADGGFQANAGLVRRHITSSYRIRGSTADVGDALQMALELGAATTHMRFFYGHALVRDSLENERLWPAPSPEPLIDVGIVVDGNGRRFADEYRGDGDYARIADTVAGPIAWSDTPADCWVIFDREAWETVGRSPLCGLNPILLEEHGTMHVADDTRDLSASTGLPAEALAATVAGYDRFCREGGALVPPRSGPTRPFRPPLHAIPLIAGITFTMGGLLVSPAGEVLRGADETPIPGLYAAGGTMGGLQGGPRNQGYAGGWSEAATFGLLAGEAAAEGGALRLLTGREGTNRL